MADNKLPSPVVSFDLQPRARDDVDQSLQIGAMDPSRFNNLHQGTVSVTDSALIFTKNPAATLTPGHWFAEVLRYVGGNTTYPKMSDYLWIDFSMVTKLLPIS